MTDALDHEVDKLLGAWSDAHAPSPQHLDGLSQQVCESLSTEQQVPVERISPSQHWFPSRQTQLLLGAAAAILVAVSAAVWMANDFLKTNKDLRDPRVAVVPNNNSQSGDPIEQFSSGQRAQKQMLLAELDRMFEGKRVWFAETDSDVVLGGDEKPTASDIAAEATVAMRLVLARRTLSTDKWERVWAADVVSRSDQVVQFLSRDSRQPATTFTAWTHLLPDGLIAYDVDVRWENGSTRQLSDNLLLSPNDTSRGASLSVDGVEYRLFHTVALLDEAKT